jgi:hypothetical protein
MNYKNYEKIQQEIENIETLEEEFMKLVYH